jgi:putative aldouronate transport system substrate-binding protein
MKNHVIRVLALVAAAAAAGAAGQQPAATGALVTPPGEFPVVREPVTLTVFAGVRPAIPDIETNLFTQMYEEMTNVHIDWEAVPFPEMVEKANVLLASGTYPEVMMNRSFTKAQLMLFGPQGVFQSLNGLIEEHGYWIKESFREVEYARPGITAPDGNIYALPTIDECYHCAYSQKYWIYRPWLEKLGLAMPETTDQLYSVLQAIKGRDPNGNGRADEVALTGAINDWHADPYEYLMNPFIYNDETFLLLDGGRVQFVANTPQWRQGLTFIKRLYDEGLIAEESFTQTSAQLRQLGENPGAVLIGSFTGGHLGLIADLRAEHGRYRDYVVVPPLRGPSGVRQTPRYGFASNPHLAITDKAKNPEVVVRWADWFYSFEGSVSLNDGPKDVGWVVPEAGGLSYTGTQGLFRPLDKYDRSLVAGELAWFDLAPKSWQAERRDGEVRPLDPSGWDHEVALVQATRQVDAFGRQEILPDMFMTEEQVRHVSELKVAIEELVNASTVRFITGDLDLQRGWDGYLQELSRAGVDRYVQLMQELVDANT